MAYARETTVDPAPLGDSTKQAILDCDTDLTNIFTHLNSHESATSGVHGVGTILQTTDVDDTPVSGATTVPISSNWAYTHNALTNSSGILTPVVTTITSAAEPTVNTDVCNCVTITALATAITSMTTNLSGTPSNFQKLIFRIKDDGTARAITWGAKFVAKGTALPTTTVGSKVLTVGFIYDTVSATWGCVASLQEA
jgi:hypothetical protein